MMTERRAGREIRSPVTERRKRDEPRAALPADLRNGWLAFESKGERCRYAPIPSDWYTMSDDELVAILRQATARKTTRRLIE